MKRKTSKRNSLPKYEFGSYVENPDMALYENEMAMINANQKAQSNKWAKGFSMAGDMMMKNGSQMLSQGLTQGLSSMNPTSAGGKFMKGNANMFGD